MVYSMGRLIVDEISVKYTTLERQYPNWISVEIYVPQPFDLVLVETSGKRRYVAWFTGTNWDGYKMKPTDIILRWKRVKGK